MCTHAFHRTDSNDSRTHSCPRRVSAGNKNTPGIHHPRRRNVTTLIVGFKKSGHKRKTNVTKKRTPET